jgi:hypothetical protein
LFFRAEGGRFVGGETAIGLGIQCVEAGGYPDELEMRIKGFANYD